ncbi:MAG: ABC transporter ATP-binding protein [Propionibacteriaceae bacterium]|nr:ABC transporter ATP-binding protein [Propionibacteriaceae bacterium]
MNPAVIVDGLTVKRGKTQVFDGFSATIASGRITGLLGPSGCGKTTLIRAIVGIQKIQSGSVVVLGRQAGELSLRDQVSYSSQADGVYKDLSVKENIEYYARLASVSEDDVARVIDLVGLGSQTKQIVASLSGGQSRRVSLAVALLGSPQVVVLDEPTVGLDPVLRASLWDIFASQAAQGTTFIVSSHVMDEAARCDDLILIRQGQLVAATTPERLLSDTGQKDAEAAFLYLIRKSEQDAGAGQDETSVDSAPAHNGDHHDAGGQR